MKLAIIGSYGHVGAFLDGAAAAGVRIAAAARWGEDDPLGFVRSHQAAPANTAIYDDYLRMLDEQAPDVVGVFMPLHRLAGASMAAAHRGCHVISEKPLATSLEDLAALREAARAGGSRIVAYLSIRGRPVFQAARQAVMDGRIGRPVLACGQKSYPFNQRDDFYKDRRTYGGTIPWQAIHAIDFVSYCTGLDYTRAAAMHSNAAHPSHPGMEDNGGILLAFAGGGHAIVSFDYLRPWGQPGRRWGDDRLRIVGTEGIVEIVEEGTRVRLMTPRAVEELPLGEPRDLLGEFIASIAGRGEGLITMAESFRATEVALKARQAADTGRIVDL